MTALQAWTPAQLPPQNGKHFAITGANSGIGLEAARILAEKGAHITLLCRNQTKAQTAIDDIRTTAPDATLEFIELDLMSLTSIRATAKVLAKSSERIDAFVNNAGIMAVPFAKTEDGFESQFGTNHLGHFALNGLLFERFKADRTRIVSLSSVAHWFGRLNFDNLNGERRYNPWVAYGQAKLANLMYIRELQRRLDKADIPLTAVACHPGYSATNLQQYGARLKGAKISEFMNGIANMLFAQSAAQGSWPTVFAAASESAREGRYYGPQGMFEARGKVGEARVGRHAQHVGNAERLWQVSEELTQVRWGI